MAHHKQRPGNYNDVMVRVKICGLTRREDVEAAVRLGADALGFNFFTGTPRYVSPETASALLRDLPPFVEPVALFVEQPLRHILQSAQTLGWVRTIQWHGDDPPLPPGLPYRFVPAFAVRDAGSLTAIMSYLSRCRECGRMPSAVLLDGHAAGKYGGTGQTARWDLLADWQADVPVILAGGLTADNVAEAIRQVRPYGVDVAGGVEVEPGRKDHDKIRRFIEQVHSAG
jgi:phosphoribosylanthranilate isomerase